MPYSPGVNFVGHGETGKRGIVGLGLTTGAGGRGGCRLRSKAGWFCPITAISQESVCFDPQLMANPEISGVEYQQGELQGYEVREYLLEKWGRKCAYCGAVGVPPSPEQRLF